MDRAKILNVKDPPNSLEDQLINAGIMAGVGFFSYLIGKIPTIGAGDWKMALIEAGISAGFQFFITLAVQRKLMKKEEHS